MESLEPRQLLAANPLLLPTLTFTVSAGDVSGEINMETLPHLAPLSVENISNYVEDGDYKDTIFHRLDKTPGQQVIQTGIVTSTTAELIDPSQFGVVSTDSPVVNEHDASERPNVRTAVGLARTSDPDSATSQFYINTQDNPGFDPDPGFAVFANVTDMTFVDFIATLDILPVSDAPFSLATVPFADVDSDRFLVRIESVAATGTIHGTKFVDTDGDGIQDVGEVGLEGVEIFIDVNDSGDLDAGDLSTTTDADGRYAFRLELPNAKRADFTVREVVPSGFFQTVPVAGFHTVTVRPGLDTDGVDFGNAPLPTAVDDDRTVAEDSTDNELTVLVNDELPLGVAGDLTITGVGTPSHGGSFSISPDGMHLIYSPAENFTGEETVTYAIEAPNGGTASATVRVTVTSENDAPVAVNDSYGVAVNETLIVEALGVLDNDTDVDGDTLSALLVDDVSSGTLTLDSDGSFTYTPNADFVGTDQFTYRADDGIDSSNLATVTIEVTDASPSSLAGSVFRDLNDNGVDDEGDLPLADVAVRLDGPEGFSETTTTAADGSYRFENLEEGDYTITEDPNRVLRRFLFDGADTVGTQGGTVDSELDEIAVTPLAADTDGADNAFGEGGRRDGFFSRRDFLASTRAPNLVAAVDTTQDTTLFYSLGDGWEDFTAAEVLLSDDLAEIELQVTDDSGTKATTIDATDSTRARFFGASEDAFLVGIIGGPEDFGFTPVVAPATLTLPGTADAPQAVRRALASDAVMAALVDEAEEEDLLPG